jgi:hypothetical protein
MPRDLLGTAPRFGRVTLLLVPLLHHGTALRIRTDSDGAVRSSQLRTIAAASASAFWWMPNADGTGGVWLLTINPAMSSRLCVHSPYSSCCHPVPEYCGSPPVQPCFMIQGLQLTRNAARAC